MKSRFTKKNTFVQLLTTALVGRDRVGVKFKVLDDGTLSNSKKVVFAEIKETDATIEGVVVLFPHTIKVTKFNRPLKIRKGESPQFSVGALTVTHQ